MTKNQIFLILLNMDKLVEKVNAAIVKIAKGDRRALGKLYSLTGGYLLAMAKTYLADRSYAEDIVSEVFLKVVRSAEGFDEGKNGLNWLFKITKNTALNHNASESRKKCESLDEKEDFLPVFSAFEGDRIEILALKTAMEALTDEERRLLYLRYWEGYTVRELAAIVMRPSATVQDALTRIHKKLKGKL